MVHRGMLGLLRATCGVHRGQRPHFEVGLLSMKVTVSGLKFDEKSIGDGLQSPKRLLWPSRPLVLRMIYDYYYYDDPTPILRIL